MYSDFGRMWFQQKPVHLARSSVPQSLRTSPSEISNGAVQCLFAAAQFFASFLSYVLGGPQQNSPLLNMGKRFSEDHVP